ncbi:MAG: hypothetical protein ACI4OE_07020 [Alphaproteobacteria bacterium]
MASINPGLLMGLAALDKVDTKDYDNVLKNFQATANTMSGNENLGNWNWSVDGSDAARQRAENATYQAYIDKLTPQFENQTNDMQTRLVNQGLTPGSEAYERAMTDLQNNQNDAISQAAYASVLSGQNAFSQSLNNEIAAGNYGNNAQSAYINQIWNLLQNSMSGYDKEMQQANLWTQLWNDKQKANAANQKGGWSGALSGAAQGAAAGSALGPYGALAGGALGAFQGYNS